MGDEDFEVVEHNLALEATLLPPAEGLCQQCAYAHEPEMPHNQQTLHWQYWFYQHNAGIWPSWRDAMAHCTTEMQEAWIGLLRARGVDVDERGLM